MENVIKISYNLNKLDIDQQNHVGDVLRASTLFIFPLKQLGYEYEVSEVVTNEKYIINCKLTKTL